ncbi:MAG: hypothetical protein ABIR66_13915 [Saprospiraceae bacterium]
MKPKNSTSRNIMRTLSRIAVLIASVGSLDFMYNGSHQQKSIILMLLFTGWVMLPFAGLLVFDTIAKSWSSRARNLLYWFILILSVASLIAYSGVLLPSGTKTAFIFLVAPVISWLIIILVIMVSRYGRDQRDHIH